MTKFLFLAVEIKLKTLRKNVNNINSIILIFKTCENSNIYCYIMIFANNMFSYV